MPTTLRTTDPMPDLLRFLRDGCLVRVAFATGGGETLGRITACGPEHVVLATGGGPEDSRVIFVDEVARIGAVAAERVVGGHGR